MSPTSDKTSGIGKRRKAAKEESSDAYKRRRREIAEAAVRVFDRMGLQGVIAHKLVVMLCIQKHECLERLPNQT